MRENGRKGRSGRKEGEGGDRRGVRREEGERDGRGRKDLPTPLLPSSIFFSCLASVTEP